MASQAPGEFVWAYTLRNIREEILPLLTGDDEASVRSVREIRTFSEGEPEAILVPSHDPSAWHELRRGVAKP